MLSRSLIRVVAVLSIAITAALGAPASSQAIAYIPPTTVAPGIAVPANYAGYANFNANYCAPNMMCTRIFRSSLTAWMLTANGGWAVGTLAHNEVMYARGWFVPYNNTGWHWAYSYRQQRWFAVPSTQLTIYTTLARPAA